MGPAGSSDRIEAHIQGNVSGQVAVGKYIYQIYAAHGGKVEIAPQQPQPRPRATPVSVRPAPFPDLLDREKEVETATNAFRSATPVAFHGEAGIGKTVLLEYLAHHPEADRFPDGVVHLCAIDRTWDDLLQSLFEAFYEVDPGTPFKPTEMQVRHALREKRALILLDDVGLKRERVEALMSVAPRSVFVLASETRLLWGRGKAVPLSGLPMEDALALVERELGRPLTDPERSAAEALCTALKGHPLHILRAVARVHEEGKSLEEVARSVQTADPVGTLTAEAVASLPEAQRQLLAVLALLDGAPLPADHLAALSGVRNVEPASQALVRRGLAQAHSPRYSLTGGLGAYLRGVWDLTPWVGRALAHFIAWAEETHPSPGRVAEVAEPILRVLKWAAADERWSEILRLSRAVEGGLALACRWGAWEQVLRRALQAAQELGDRAAEAWALHQLGTRALCLGDARAARDALTKALRLRRSLGDEPGAAVTRHNLDILAKALPPRRPSRTAPKPRLPTLAWVGVGLAAAAVLAGLAILGWSLITRQPTPTPTEGVWNPEPPRPVAPELEAELACDPRMAERRVEWQWTPVEGAAGYELYLEILEPEHEVYPSQFTEEPTWEMDLPCERAYLWRVRAIGPEGIPGEWSEEWVFHVRAADREGPPAPLPIAPKDGEQIPCPGGGEVAVPFRWEPVDDPSGVDSYGVQIEAVALDTPVGATPPSLHFETEDPFAEVELPCGWNYRWRVQATDGAGNSGEWSSWWEFRVMALEEGDTLPPPPPAVVGPGSPDIDEPENLYPCDQVVLQWAPVAEDPGGSGGLGDRVRRRRDEGGTGEWESIEPYFIIYAPSVDVTEWLSTGTYRWQVWTIDNAGNHGEPSPWLYFECPIG